MKTVQHYVSNGAGHKLALFQTYDETKLDKNRNPVVIMPGYGMNSFIFSYHPNGLSLEGSLVEAGFEVWRADLRGQGESLTVGGSDDYSLEDLALTDVRVVLDAVQARSLSSGPKVDVLGCSLGGTLMFIHAVLHPRNKIGAMVAMGSPLRWESVHPLIRIAFSSPAVAGWVHIKGTRRVAELMVPHLAKHVPWLLSVYMNPGITDTGAISDLVKTVEDPNRHVNREIANWVRRKDLLVRRVNITEGVGGLYNPLLCIVANGDGVVPPDTAASAYYRSPSPNKMLLQVGTTEIQMAHADMFVSREAQARVFRPLVAWLQEQNARGTNR